MMNRKQPLFLLLPLLMLISCHVSAEETVSDLQSRMSKLERMVDNRGLLNILSEMESLRKEVRELRGEIEQQAYTIKQMKRRSKMESGEQNASAVTIAEDQAPERTKPEAVEQDNLPVIESREIEERGQIVDREVEKMSSIQPVETYVAQQQAMAESRTPTTNKSDQGSERVSDSDEEDRYTEAFTLLKQGQHDKAVDKFRIFLQQYPASSYADNAQYWLGESYYAKRKFKMAITEYRALLSDYPQSGKTSHAQLKIGYCYYELGQVDYAQGELEDLVARYPGTSAASLAEERLDHIRSQ